jgi:hypothetical protein
MPADARVDDGGTGLGDILTDGDDLVPGLTVLDQGPDSITRAGLMGSDARPRTASVARLGSDSAAGFLSSVTAEGFSLQMSSNVVKTSPAAMPSTAA